MAEKFDLPFVIFNDKDIIDALGYYNLPPTIVNIIEERLNKSSMETAQKINNLECEVKHLEFVADDYFRACNDIAEIAGDLKDYIDDATRLNRKTLTQFAEEISNRLTEVI